MPLASRGSQRWLQIAVNRYPDIINTAIREAAGIEDSVSIEWLSPLSSEDYVEYRDRAFLTRLGVSLDRRQLFDFWPPGGPMWDGLARLSNGEVILLEAKAHIPEIVSSATRASPKARTKIEQALKETHDHLARTGSNPWSQTFYQYANRLAHLYLLRHLNKVNARMVFVYFTGADDVGGPRSRLEWEGANKVVEVYLGLRPRPLTRYVHHAFVDVAALSGSA